MNIAKQIVVGEKQLAASSTVSVLEVSAADLWRDLQSPSSLAFVEATIMVADPLLDSYVAMFRVLGAVQGTPFTNLQRKRRLLWDIEWDEAPYGIVTSFDMDLTGGLIRVRVTGTADAAGSKATVWLKAWANG